MENYNILLVEDEIKLANHIKKGLDENGYPTDVAYDGLSGKNKILSSTYDLIILDIKLPQINGYELCSMIRNMGHSTPVILLTAQSSIDNKITGFELGADDYLTKPFEFRELLLRIKALFKRVKTDNNEAIITIADLVINTDSKTVFRNNIKIELTAKEFFLLEFLASNKGKVISRAQIADKIWDIKFDTGTNIIDVYVNFLRKKIDKNFVPKLIHTVIGMGYVLRVE